MFLNESRARCADRCLRNFYWRYLHGGHGIASVRPDKNLVWGTLMHAGLAAHYKSESIHTTLHDCLHTEAFPDWDALDYSTKNEWLEEVDWIEKVVARYTQWAAPKDNFNIEGVEQSGAVALGDGCWQCGRPYPGLREVYLSGKTGCPSCGAEPHVFVFRLDLLVRDDYGFRVIDHKSTSGGVDSYFLESWDYSPQLWGYCYGAEKQSGQKIGGYSINIIRKVNAAGEEPDLTKSCPGCGRKKAKGCDLCKDSPTPGRVARPPKPADEPFHRADFSFTESKRNWFIEQRTRIANKITEHSRRLAEGDPSAFPHNPSSFSCDPNLCYGARYGLKLEDIFVDDTRYRLKGPDYVSIKRLAMEEAA